MNKRDKEPPGTGGLLIGIVGPCSAGKSTLVKNLNQLGYTTRHIAQEHSYVKDMWQRLTKPDILVFLDASYPVCTRRGCLDWTEAEWKEQQRRLRNAREHAGLYVDTSELSIEEVTQKVVDYIQAYLNNLASSGK